MALRFEGFGPNWRSLILVGLAALLLGSASILAKPAITPAPTAAACYQTDQTYSVNHRDVLWEVKGTYRVRYNACTGYSLLWATCTKNVWFPYSVSVTWCGAWKSGRNLDLGWNANISAPGRTVSCWSRMWLYGAVTGPGSSNQVRKGCG